MRHAEFVFLNSVLLNRVVGNHARLHWEQQDAEATSNKRLHRRRLLTEVGALRRVPGRARLRQIASKPVTQDASVEGAAQLHIEASDTLGSQGVMRSTIYLVEQIIDARGVFAGKRRLIGKAGCGTGKPNAVFLGQKVLKTRRKFRGQFLPGKYLAASAKVNGSHTAHDDMPALDQVRTPLVRHQAKAFAAGMGRQNVADQLIGSKLFVLSRKSTYIENFL